MKVAVLGFLTLSALSWEALANEKTCAYKCSVKSEAGNQVFVQPTDFQAIGGWESRSDTTCRATFSIVGKTDAADNQVIQVRVSDNFFSTEMTLVDGENNIEIEAPGSSGSYVLKYRPMGLIFRCSR